MWTLTHKGTYVRQYGSPEYRVYNMVGEDDGILFELILQELGKVGKNGYEICLKDSYLEYDLDRRMVSRIKKFPKDIIQFYLNEIENGYIFSKTIMNMLKKRNLIENCILY